MVESGSGDKKVVQFDLKKANVANYAELDLFGYMYTYGRNAAITRKAVVGLTKCVSLGSYVGDMAFYANHDLIQRMRNQGGQANPNPYSREEHMSYYKMSCVIDLERLGRDEMIVKLDPAAEARLNPLNPVIKVTSIDGGSYRVVVRVPKKQRKSRLVKLLEALRSGLWAQSSGELNLLKPIALIAAFVRVPSPILDDVLLPCQCKDYDVIAFGPSGMEGKVSPYVVYDLAFLIRSDFLRNGWYIPRGQGGGFYIQGWFCMPPANGASPFIGIERSKEGENITWEDFLKEAERSLPQDDINEDEAQEVLGTLENMRGEDILPIEDSGGEGKGRGKKARESAGSSAEEVEE